MCTTVDADACGGGLRLWVRKNDAKDVTKQGRRGTGEVFFPNRKLPYKTKIFSQIISRNMKEKVFILGILRCFFKKAKVF